MQHLQVEQGTEEWFNARLGIPTASNFSKIMTTKCLQSSSFQDYLNTLLAEKIINGKDELNNYKSKMMEHGNETEDEAVLMYEFQTGTETEKNGIFLNNKGTVGASPDRLVGENGLVEVKCPLAKKIVEYKRDKKDLPSIYTLQVQGQLWIAEREWCDFITYHPQMPLIINRIYRDEKIITGLTKYLTKFTDLLQSEYERIK